MGAQSFCHIVESTSVSKAFNDLVAEARYEYGSDAYNGTISTCGLAGRPAKTYAKYSKEVEREAYDFVKEKEFGQKWTAQYIDLGVCGYEMITVKRKGRKSDAKFQMMYNVYDLNGKRIASEKIKADAESRAMKYAYETGEDAFIMKEQTGVTGSPLVCNVSVEKKRYDKKPRIPRGPGKELVEIHKYMFYGWAAY